METDSKTPSGTEKQASLSIEHGHHAVLSADGEMVTETGQVINASGHVQELKRNFSLWGLYAIAVVIGDCWALMGGSIVSLPDPVKPSKMPGN